jgi:alpha-mannosidase
MLLSYKEKRMSKHHLQNLAEQIANKGHGSAPFHNENRSYQINEEVQSEDMAVKVAEEDSSIKLRAYQIHLEKGGSDLDNWLEAERCFKNNDKAVSRLINEGDPNTQK